MTNADRIRAMSGEELSGFFHDIENKIYPWNKDRIRLCRECRKTGYEAVIKRVCGRTETVSASGYPCEVPGRGCPHGDKIDAWLSKEAEE